MQVDETQEARQIDSAQLLAVVLQNIQKLPDQMLVVADVRVALLLFHALQQLDQFFVALLVGEVRLVHVETAPVPVREVDQVRDFLLWKRLAVNVRMQNVEQVGGKFGGILIRQLAIFILNGLARDAGAVHDDLDPFLDRLRAVVVLVVRVEDHLETRTVSSLTFKRAQRRTGFPGSKPKIASNRTVFKPRTFQGQILKLHRLN